MEAAAAATASSPAGAPNSKAPVVYSPAYDIAFNGIEKQHPFDSSKWGRVCSFLVDAGFLQNDRVVDPLEASEDDLLVVHSESYLNTLKSSEKAARLVEVAESRFQPQLIVYNGGTDILDGDPLAD